MKQRLSGVLEVTIYPPEHSVRSIIARCREPDSTPAQPRLDIAKLRADVNAIDRGLITQRKTIWSRVYEEARISYLPGRGICFADMLQVVAYYTLAADRDALPYVGILSLGTGH